MKVGDLVLLESFYKGIPALLIYKDTYIDDAWLTMTVVNNTVILSLCFEDEIIDIK
jgi:hypothetical protein